MTTQTSFETAGECSSSIDEDGLSMEFLLFEEMALDLSNDSELDIPTLSPSQPDIITPSNLNGVPNRGYGGSREWSLTEENAMGLPHITDLEINPPTPYPSELVDVLGFENESNTTQTGSLSRRRRLQDTIEKAFPMTDPELSSESSMFSENMESNRFPQPYTGSRVDNKQVMSEIIPAPFMGVDPLQFLLYKNYCLHHGVSPPSEYMTTMIQIINDSSIYNGTNMAYSTSESSLPGEIAESSYSGTQTTKSTTITIPHDGNFSNSKTPSSYNLPETGRTPVSDVRSHTSKGNKTASARFPCLEPGCKELLGSKNAWIRHMEGVHIMPFKYSADFCNHSNLILHQKRLVCEVCHLGNYSRVRPAKEHLCQDWYRADNFKYKDLKDYHADGKTLPGSRPSLENWATPMESLTKDYRCHICSFHDIESVLHGWMEWKEHLLDHIGKGDFQKF